MTLPAQVAIWPLGSPMPSASRWRPIRNRVSVSRDKPDHGTGLWTSTMRPDRTVPVSSWAEWCADNMYGHGTFAAWRLVPSPTARIYTIDGYDDLDRALRCYRRRGETIGSLRRDGHLDFEAIAEQGVDAIHLTERGVWATHLSEPDDLYNWDCESTLWLRWAFTSVTFAGIVTIAGSTDR